MKKIKIFSGIALLSLLFTSCEDVIQVKLDEGSKLLVVDAFINDLRIDQKVKLSYTDAYFSNTNPPPVTNAEVTLNDITAGKTYTFVHAGNGEYLYPLGLDTIAYINHSYKLEVLYEGISYTSYTTQKRTTVIDSIQAKKTEEKNIQQKEGYICTLWARDVPGPVKDYYWIKAFRNDVLFNQGSQINVAIDAASGAGADGFIFTPPIARGITPFGEVYKKFDKCRVEIHSISETTYNFLLQVISQTTNSGLFATTPENVKTNINTPNGSPLKAIGWFNMASVSAMEKIVQ